MVSFGRFSTKLRLFLTVSHSRTLRQLGFCSRNRVCRTYTTFFSVEWSSLSNSQGLRVWGAVHWDFTWWMAFSTPDLLLAADGYCLETNRLWNPLQPCGEKDPYFRTACDTELTRGPRYWWWLWISHVYKSCNTGALRCPWCMEI